MLLLHYCVPLDPRTKKNSPQIAGTGSRCPYCSKFKKQFVVPSKANKAYNFMAKTYLLPKPDEPVSIPVQVTYKFFMATRRKVDEVNLTGAMDDLLVSEKILADDNSNIIKSHDGTRVYYDKQNPRTEIYIYTYEEEDYGIG